MRIVGGSHRGRRLAAPADRSIRPDSAFWSGELGEYLLPYRAVQVSDSPDEVLLDFLQSSYEAAAELADWDRPALERNLGPA